jgi:hypothetical protein
MQRKRHVIQRALGAVALILGVAAMTYGGYLAALMTTDGASPHYLEGWALCLAGLFAIGLGLWLCGVEIDWRDS